MLFAAAAVAAGAVAPRAAAARGGSARSAEASVSISLGTGLRLPGLRTAVEFPLLCFDSLLTMVINPGCFQTDTSPGDCASHSQHFFVQLFDPIDYFGPTFPGTYRVTRMLFVTNDGATRFPSAGVVVKPYNPQNFFPTPQELANLQITNVQSPHDTAIVSLDLQQADLTFTRDDVLFVCLQFPEGGVLSDVGVGPGIAVDPLGQNPRCDFLTVTAGTAWYEPASAANLDWGFELDVAEVDTVAVESIPWTRVKIRYRDP
jgi:hypothetical protein